MDRTRLEADREQILALRRRTNALDERLPSRRTSLRLAAWAGLQDSMPRAALLSIHARVEGTVPTVLDDRSLVQVWGPHYSVFAVPARDHAVFTLGKCHDDEKARRRAEELADRLEALLDGGPMTRIAAARALEVDPNSFRYAAETGRVLIRWEGARDPVVWTVPPPDQTAAEARLELARRYLHIYGPATPESFSRWAGIGARRGHSAFAKLTRELAPIATPVGDAFILSRDETDLRQAPPPPAAARLLPSGDPYFLLHGRDRELLLPTTRHRSALWTPRVWPGALLVAGEVVGTWRRADSVVAVQLFRPLTPAERESVAAEAETLPLPGTPRRGSVVWT